MKPQKKPKRTVPPKIEKRRPYAPQKDIVDPWEDLGAAGGDAGCASVTDPPDEPPEAIAWSQPAPVIIDRTAHQMPAHPRSKLSGGKTVLRPLESIDSIVLHQTGLLLPVSARQVKAAGGDHALARYRRVARVPAHTVVLREEGVIRVNSADRYMHHAGPLNSRSYAYEIEGSLPGLLSSPHRTTWGGNPMTLTPLQISSCREDIRQICAEIPTIRYILAHRQSSKSRRSDPGEEVWREIVLPVASALGLTLRPLDTWGSGQPIPEAWQPGTGVGY